MFGFRKFKNECTVSTEVRDARVIYIINHPTLDAQNIYAYSSELDMGYRRAYRIVKNFRKANLT